MVYINYLYSITHQKVLYERTQLHCLCDRNCRSLFWTLHTLNIGTICYTYNVQAIFWAHPYTMHHMNVKCCNTGLNAGPYVVGVGHCSLVHSLLHTPIGKKNTWCDVRWSVWPREYGQVWKHGQSDINWDHEELSAKQFEIITWCLKFYFLPL